MIELIIKYPERYDEDTKIKFINIFLSNEEYQKTLMKYLSSYRENERNVFDKSIIIIISDLFKLVLDRAVKNNNYELVNFIIVLSLTYYHLNEDEIPENKINFNNDNNRNNINNKVFISEYLKQDQVFKDSAFWKNYLDELIKIEEEKYKRIKEISPITEKEIMNAICPSIYALIQNMLDYNLETEFILYIIGEVIEKIDDNKINISNYIMLYAAY